jgi:hypothetical protein
MSQFSPKKVRRVFFGLLCLFLVPLLLASWMVLKEKPLFSQTTNHGQLLLPPLDIAQLNIQPTKKWLLLYIVANSCDADCAKALYNMRQIRTATGKDMDRVQCAALTFQAQDSHLQSLLASEFKGTAHWLISPQNFQKFSQEKSFGNGIYIADPLGNVMMFYPQRVDPMGIFKDLTRLLKLSHIG